MSSAPDFCDLHGEPFVDDQGKVVWGLVVVGFEFDEYLEAKGRLFPNSSAKVHVGCVYRSSDPPFVPVRHCPKCRDAELAWKPFRDTFD